MTTLESHSPAWAQCSGAFGGTPQWKAGSSQHSWTCPKGTAPAPRRPPNPGGTTATRELSANTPTEAVFGPCIPQVKASTRFWGAGLLQASNVISAFCTGWGGPSLPCAILAQDLPLLPLAQDRHGRCTESGRGNGIRVEVKALSQLLANIGKS